MVIEIPERFLFGFSLCPAIDDIISKVEIFGDVYFIFFLKLLIR